MTGANCPSALKLLGAMVAAATHVLYLCMQWAEGLKALARVPILGYVHLARFGSA